MSRESWVKFNRCSRTFLVDAGDGEGEETVRRLRPRHVDEKRRRVVLGARQLRQQRHDVELPRLERLPAPV